jgi:hypothetical protein
MFAFLSKPLGKATLFAVILLALVFTVRAYGNSRYHEGRKEVEAAYAAAHDKLLKDAAAAENQADKESVARTLDFVAKAEHEKEKIDATIADGGDPFDVLFGADGVRTEGADRNGS